MADDPRRAPPPLQPLDEGGYTVRAPALLAIAVAMALGLGVLGAVLIFQEPAPPMLPPPPEAPLPPVPPAVAK